MSTGVGTTRGWLGLLIVGFLGGTLQAQNILESYFGDTEGERFGFVAPAGDVDGDGLDDLIIGSPGDDEAGSAAGSATVIGSATGMIHEFFGDGPNDAFGTAVAGAGDVDGDGRADVIVGAPEPDGVSTGYAIIFSGATGNIIHRFAGSDAGGRFGAAVAGAGDIDMDGLADVLVGAPGEDVNGPDSGSAYIFGGQSALVLAAVYGNNPGDNYGSTVAGDLPDTLKGDAEPTVIIGATQSGNAGKGYVETRDRVTLAVQSLFQGDEPFDAFGTRVQFLGDVNGDEVLDLGVGTDPRNDVGTPTGFGYALVFDGATGDLIHRFDGTEMGSGFGMEIAGVGDVDGDGIDDLAVGEPFADGNGLDSGSIHIYSGLSGTLVTRVDGPTSGSLFGLSIAFADDLDGDEQDDFAVGAPQDDFAGTDTGTVLIFSFGTWKDLGNGVAGLQGVPLLAGSGDMEAETSVTLALDDAAPSMPVSLVIGYSLFVDETLSLLMPTQDVIISSLSTDAQGGLTYVFNWPGGVPSGVSVYSQFLVLDSAADTGISRSNLLHRETP